MKKPGNTRGLTIIEIGVAIAIASFLTLVVTTQILQLKRTEEGQRRTTDNLTADARKSLMSATLEIWETVPIRCANDEVLTGLKPNRSPICMKIPARLPTSDIFMQMGERFGF